jgi:hypothetical protein
MRWSRFPVPASVVLDKVAGPVGEALIMTAAGLFVAIPAVLAYNALTRANRLVMAQLDGFAHDLHAFFATGARRAAVKGKTAIASAARTRCHGAAGRLRPPCLSVPSARAASPSPWRRSTPRPWWT